MFECSNSVQLLEEKFEAGARTVEQLCAALPSWSRVPIRRGGEDSEGKSLKPHSLTLMVRLWVSGQQKLGQIRGRRRSVWTSAPRGLSRLTAPTRLLQPSGRSSHVAPALAFFSDWFWTVFFWFWEFSFLRLSILKSQELFLFFQRDISTTGPILGAKIV